MPSQPGFVNITGMRGRRKGGLPPAVSTPPRPESLAAGVAAFLEHLSARAYSKGSVEAHHWALRGFLEWSDGQGLTSAASFTRAKVEEFQIHLHHFRSPRTKEPLGVNTQLGRLGCVRRLFAWLCRTGTIPANPAADLDLPRKQARRLPKALSQEEIDRLFSLPNPADPMGLRDRAILELFYATGIRRTEMTELDPGDYDPDSRTLLIRHGKGDKSRLLPVGGRAAFWLDRYLAEARPLFDHQPNETALFLSGYGTRITPAYLGNWVAGQMKRVGITKPGACHLFRHSCATDMHLGGADIRYVQEMLGHARLETTQIYTHVNIVALAGVHARTHPHGLLPNDHEHGFREAVVLDPAPEDPEPTLDSEVPDDFPDDFACGPEAEVLPVASDMPTSLANPIPAPRMVPEPPGGEANPPEAGPPAPPKRPPPPSPWNPPNPLASNALQQEDKSSPGAHVAYYGYRYYHPDLGRWISRDPIGEQGGVNFFAFVGNDGINFRDLFGLEPRGEFEGKSNCIGFALTGRPGYCIWPNENESLENYVKRRAPDATCSEVNSSKECKPKEKHARVLIYFYTPKLYKGDPWKDPQGWRSVPRIDIHAMFFGCKAKKWQNVVGTQNNPPNVKDVNPEEWDKKGRKVVCCYRPCKEKKEDRSGACIDSESTYQLVTINYEY